MDWCERQEDEEINEEKLAQAIYRGEITGIDIWTASKLSQCMWGFLNHCVKNVARDLFDGADPLDGLDAWRRIINSIQKTK